MDYKEKYLYYKQKYLSLKYGQMGGGKKLCIIFNNKYNMKERDRFPKVYFLNFLSKRLEENGYEIILLKEDYPNEIKKIMETKKIDLILNFEDYYIRFSRHFHSNLNMKDVYQFYLELEKKGVKIYPPPKFHIYTNSKSYALELYKNNELVLPHSKVFKLKKDKKEWTKIYNHCKKLKQLCDFTVIKVSFSADMIDIFYVRNDKTKTINKFIEFEEFDKIKELYNSYIEKDELDLVIIVQPYNKIVSQRDNEYRMWYINDKFVDYFCFGPERNSKGELVRLIENQKYNQNNQIHKNIKFMGDKLYEFIKQKIRKHMKDNNFKIIALRLDMSYAIDELFLDKYTVTIDNKKYRFYCNELENIDGTFYINIPITDTTNNKKFDTRFFQNTLTNAIINYLE